MTGPTDDVEMEVPRRKRKKGFSLARKVGKAYVDRKGRKHQEVEISPLHGRRAYTGKGKIHVREDEKGKKGTLIINGSTVVHLNETALECLLQLFAGEAHTDIVKRMTKSYKVKRSIARDDLETLVRDLEALEQGHTPKRGTREDPLSKSLSAPVRADLALTYRELSSSPEGGQVAGEMTTEECLKAIDQIKTYGIPHLCFTGGEPTVREDLVELIDHAASMGLMTGLLTNGERIGNKAFLGRLMDAGLDYVQISIASHDETVHSKIMGTPHHRKTVNGIRQCLKAGLPVLVNIFLTKESEYGLEDTVSFLVGLGVRYLTVNPKVVGEDTIPEWMQQEALERARRAVRGRARVFWFGPVPGPDPRKDREVQSIGELAMGDLEWGGGRTHIFIHPDGNISPGRGHGEVLGNVLTHQWNMVWYHTVMKEIRSKKLEERRWRALQELGFSGYPLFPNLPVTPETEDGQG
jgi:MoaA/NifB/PqqE/SkfB family radical SAM enzyme